MKKKEIKLSDAQQRLLQDFVQNKRQPRPVDGKRFRTAMILEHHGLLKSCGTVVVKVEQFADHNIVSSTESWKITPKGKKFAATL